MDLSKIQEKLSNYIYNYDVKDTDLESILVQKYIEKTNSKSLHIYRNNILFHVIDVMKDIYEATAFLLGPENFNFFVREYLLQHPPDRVNIDEYGKDFPDFLSDRSELRKDVPYIRDIALLDYFWTNIQKAGEEILLPKGIFDLWRIFLRNELANQEIKIDYQNTETVISTSIEGSLFLIKKK